MDLNHARLPFRHARAELHYSTVSMQMSRCNLLNQTASHVVQKPIPAEKSRPNRRDHPARHMVNYRAPTRVRRRSHASTAPATATKAPPIAASGAVQPGVPSPV